jgi:hypothetical protein
MAEGALGYYRYLNQIPMCASPEHTAAIHDLKLWRSTIPHRRPPMGFNTMTDDINYSRGGDYLYIVYNRIGYSGPFESGV